MEKYGKCKCKHTTKTSPQGCLGCCTSSGGKSQTSSSNAKKVVSRDHKSKSFTWRRKAKTFSESLGINNKRPRNIILNKGIQNTISKRTGTIFNTSNSPDEQRKTTSCGSRGRDNVEERCNLPDKSCSRGIYKQFILSRKKGWGSATSDKPKKPESVCAVRTFQNGRFSFPEVHAKKGRLHVQTRPQRCLFFPSASSGVSKICTVPMEGKAIPIQMSMFWVGASSQDIYKTVEGPYCSSTETEHPNYNLHRRYTSCRENLGGNSISKGYSHIFPPASRICIESKKVNHSSMSRTRIFGTNNKVNELNIVPPSRKIEKGTGPLQRNAQEGSYIDFKIDQTHWPFVINNPSSITCSVVITTPTTIANSFFEGKEVLSIHCFSEPISQRGIVVVDRESCLLKWESISSKLCKSGFDANRCLKEGLGSSVQGSSNWGTLVQQGTNFAHQCTRTISSQTGSHDFWQNRKYKVNTFSDRQQNSIVLSVENGRNNQPDNDQDCQRNLGYLIEKEHNYFSRIFTKCTESGSRLGITTHPGLLRLEAMSSYHPENQLPLWTSSHRPLCVPSVPSIRQLSLMETRSSEQRGRCNATHLVNSIRANPVCIPSFLSNSKSFKQNCTRSSPCTDLDNSGLAITSMVSGSSTVINSKPNNVASISSSLVKCQRGETPVSGISYSKVSGMEGFRKSLLDTGISKSAASLISSSRRPGSILNYDSSWRKWTSWCSEKQIDPVHCPISFILDFLAELFESNYEYRTINSYRSAISAYHSNIGGKPIGQHPEVCSLLKGVFIKRPPKPRYAFTWDVQTVLNFIKENWADSKKLSDKDLTYKLVMLLALTSASRACTIHCLDIRFMAKYTHFVQFRFDRLHKGWKNNKGSPIVKYFEYNADKDLCVVSTLQVYLDKSQKWRNTNQTQLLLSHINPHKEVTSCTISRWIKDVIKLAGINTDIFKGHSSRSAASIGAGL